MLECENAELFAQFLINIGFGDRAEYNYNVQYRALRILQNIVNTATLEKLIQQDISTFRYISRDCNILSFWRYIYMNLSYTKKINFAFFIFQKIYEVVALY